MAPATTQSPILSFANIPNSRPSLWPNTTGGFGNAIELKLLYYLERAAQVQIYAMWTGQRLKQLPEAVIEKTKNEIGGARFYNGPTPAERHFCALKRILDREEADYAS
jgi:hypothetical protein